MEQLRRALAANSQKCARDIEDVNSTLNHIHGVAGVSNDTIADLQQNLQLAQVETKKTSEQLKQVLHKVTQQGNARGKCYARHVWFLKEIKDYYRWCFIVQQNMGRS